MWNENEVIEEWGAPSHAGAGFYGGLELEERFILGAVNEEDSERFRATQV